MTDLSLALRNYLARDPELRSLLGRSASWDTWIFDKKPVNVRIENTSRCLIVINEVGTWSGRNDHNTMKFPRIQVDIWADPSRNEDRSVLVFDAESKIEKIQKVLDKHLHLVNVDTEVGLPFIWGTEQQIISKTGKVVFSSKNLTGPDLSPVVDSEGTLMGRMTYGITTA